MLTKQKVYDKVARHLLTQNEKAVLEENMCRYRTPDGRKCAVGCLIPDDVYHDSIEGDTVRRLLCSARDISTVLRQNLSYEVHGELLSALQTLHDESEVRTWRKGLREIAVTFDLDDSITHTRNFSHA